MSFRCASFLYPEPNSNQFDATRLRITRKRNILAAYGNLLLGCLSYTKTVAAVSWWWLRERDAHIKALTPGSCFVCFTTTIPSYFSKLQLEAWWGVEYLLPFSTKYHMERKDVLCCALRSFLHPLQNQVSSKLMTGISCPPLLKNELVNIPCAVARPSSMFRCSSTKLRLAISHVELLHCSKPSSSAPMSLLWCFQESTAKLLMTVTEARPRTEYKSSSCASSSFPPLHNTARVSYQKGCVKMACVSTSLFSKIVLYQAGWLWMTDSHCLRSKWRLSKPMHRMASLLVRDLEPPLLSEFEERQP